MKSRFGLTILLAGLIGVGGLGSPPVHAAENSAAGAPPATQPTGVPPAIPPADYAVANGHFYTETNGGSDPVSGYGVTDDGGIPMWSELQRLGGVAALGYPISQRFQLGSFIVQGFQRAVLQWRPDPGQVSFVNVMDLLHEAGKDGSLQATRQIPPQADNAADAGKTFDDLSKSRLKLLDFQSSSFKDAFNRVSDPLAVFGLPTSVITDEGASYTLRFQRAAMQLWKSDQPWAKANTVTLVNVGDLAKENGLIPAAPAKPEPGRIAVGQADIRPWSGWWWPSLGSNSAPHLFDANGPLDKYDAYVRAITGEDPRTQQWELSHFQFSDPRLDWAGKCNGWAVAALTEPEPTRPRTINGISFSVADLKGLLADYYFAAPATFLVGSRDGGVSAADFHRTMLDWVGRRRKGLVINAFDGSQQVASFAVYKYQAVYTQDPPDGTKTHVQMTVWAADYHVDPNFVGLKNWPDENGKAYRYFIYGNRDNPTGGDWEGDSVSGKFAHPQNLWYPDLSPDAHNKFGALTSPNLDYGLIEQIIRGA